MKIRPLRATARWIGKKLLTSFVLPTLGDGAAAVVGITFFSYWLLQRSSGAWFVNGLKDYCFTHTTALESKKIRLILYGRYSETFSNIFGLYKLVKLRFASLIFQILEARPDEVAARSRLNRASHD